MKLPKQIPQEDKIEYRHFFFRSDIAQSKTVLKLLTVAVGIFGFSDYFLLGLTLNFFIVEALRISLVIYSLIVIRTLEKSKDYSAYDRILLIYLFAFVFFSLFVNTTRPQGYAVEVVILGISIFAVYLALPTRFLNQTIISGIYKVGEIPILLFGMPGPDQSEFLPLIFSLLFANIIAAVAAWEFNYYRWRVFKDLNRLKKSERFVVIGQTAGMVGHDIRNPLQAITGDLYLIQQALNQTPDCKREDIAESLDAINENITYIDKIVSDLQDYTKALTLNVTDIRIQSLLRSILVIVPKTIKTEVTVDENLTILSDSTYLKRILTNLANNAIQAMPNGGTLMITVFKKEEKIQIIIEDTGVGISRQTMEHMFEPFFTTKSKGQGLGLAVVRRLVEALNGSISLESQEGMGTKFIIQLPAIS